MLYIGFSPAACAGIAFLLGVKDYRMTYLDVVFRYGAAPGENELRAIDGMREVYGVRQVQFNDAERTVRVEFDASRMKPDAVAGLLRQAGVDVRERLAMS
jgi:selenocysteine lyase/cysteine desulfurase